MGPPSGEETAIGQHELDDERVLIADLRAVDVVRRPSTRVQLKIFLITEDGVLGGHLAIALVPLQPFAKLEDVRHRVFLLPGLAHRRREF